MCNITRAFTFHLNFLATVPWPDSYDEPRWLGRGGEIILDTNGITQVAAYQHPAHNRSYLRLADRKLDIGWRKLDIFSLERINWRYNLSSYYHSLWFNSCCSCHWKLQQPDYIHSTSYFVGVLASDYSASCHCFTVPQHRGTLTK